ncbi:MAG: methyltransferase [Clostridia bacterium]|nr:methyltransferase [Clostridia bacterium]
MIEKENLGIKDYIVYQDTDLYRFTSDAILLSRFATAKKGDKVADFCSGSGIVGVNFFALNEDKVSSLTLFEMQEALYNLSLKSVKENGLEGKVSCNNLKVQDIGVEYNGAFSLILCNPPFVKKDSSYPQTDENLSVRVCKEEITLTFSELCIAVKKALKSGGRFCLVHRADRVAELISELTKSHLEVKRLQFVTGTDKKSPYLVLIEAVKDAKCGVTVLPNLVN